MAKSDWYARAFGAVADEVGAAIADVRAKLIEEGFWGRKPPEPGRGGHDLGWMRGHEGSGESVLDQLYARDPSQFVQPQDRDTPEQDHDIER